MKSSLTHGLGLALLAASLTVHAAQTVCNDNGGAGWPVPEPSITDITIAFNFGDVSRAHDIDIQVDVSKVYVGDLTARATSPQGTTVELFERPGTAIDEFTPGPPYGCNQSDILVTFDDEAAIGTNIENVCNPGAPTISGTYLPHLATGNDLAAIDGEDPNGDWAFQLVHSEPYDPGTLNQVCITAAFAAVTFDKWVSSDATCTDTIDAIAVAPGTDVYFCYAVENPGTETFTINNGDASDDQGHDLSALETTYVQNAIQTLVDGPYVAGSPGLPVGTTVNNASVTATFATANFNGTLVTGESATAVVADPVINTSTKSVVDLNGGSAEPGDILEYTVSINESAGIYTPGVQVIDVVHASLDTVNVTVLPVGATDNSVGNNIDISGITLAANGTATIVYQATIGPATAPGTSIGNTASISHAPSAVSFDAIAPTVIVSAPELGTSTKVELDVDGTPSLPGDLIRYTISINETGGNPATGVTLTDSVDANLVGVNITSIPAGAVDNSVGNNIDISNISVPANGSATVVFEANISGVAAVGTTINNSATLLDVPSGVSAAPAAGAIIVSSPAASGVKQLYAVSLNTGAPLLTRTVPTVNTNSANRLPGTSLTMNMSPVFQAPFSIIGGTPVNMDINLQRRGAPGMRDVTVELYNGGTGALLGSDTWSWNAGGTQYHTFSFTPLSDIDFAPGDFVRLVIRNTGTTNFRVRSLVNNNATQVRMDSSTVINIDTIDFYSAAYPAVTKFSSYTPGATVFIRTSVSDPFGNADISGATVTITDASPALLVNADPMTSVATPTGASRLFEYPYIVPATTDGFWDASITANEGTEATVSHSSSSIMVVGTADITVSKTSQVLSDPINASNPKAIPDAIVEYTIEVTNTGFGYADLDSIVIFDPIDPATTTLVLGNPADPAQLAQGATPSGLTFSFTNLGDTGDDVAFSSNGGVSFVTPVADGDGFDITVPPVNHIEFNPKGELRGSDGVNHPSFTIKFRLRVD